MFGCEGYAALTRNEGGNGKRREEVGMEDQGPFGYGDAATETAFFLVRLEVIEIVHPLKEGK